MLYFDRISVSKGIDENKASGISETTALRFNQMSAIDVMIY